MMTCEINEVSHPFFDFPGSHKSVMQLLQTIGADRLHDFVVIIDAAITLKSGRKKDFSGIDLLTAKMFEESILEHAPASEKRDYSHPLYSLVGAHGRIVDMVDAFGATKVHTFIKNISADFALTKRDQKEEEESIKIIEDWIKKLDDHMSASGVNVSR